MANEPIITVVGNLTGDPELRFTPSGAAVANFTVASTPRTKQGDEWVDGEAMFLGCSVWREYAEHVVESLQKGMRVIVQGRLKARTFEHNGVKQTRFELDVDEVGPSLRYATASVKRTERNGNGGGQQRQQSSGQSRQQAADPWATPAASDPWATPSANDEPPF